MPNFGRAEEYHYAVGTTSTYFHAPEKPFDPWGEKYKNDEYRKLLQRIKKAGDGRSVHAVIYYPAVAGGKHYDAALGLEVPKAQTGQQATIEQLLPKGLKGWGTPHKRNAYIGASPVDGPFPLVFMLHGLGGGHGTWYKAAEHVASQGYVVVTLAFTSDSSSTPVFDDPKLKYVKTRTPQQLQSDYRILHPQGDEAVFGGFFRFMYGTRPPFSGKPDPSKLKAVKGGGIKAGKMMGDLFEMRTEDVALAIDGMEELNKSDPLLKGRIDMENIGVMGHSLGSITSQSALVNIPRVKTAVGFNNGLPRSWEPYGGFPNKSGSADKPDGVPKDILFVIGSDDNFIHLVFREIFLKWFEDAGGDLDETMPIEIERPWPTADNPQPVALASYERATAAKMFLMFADEGHDASIDGPIPHAGEAAYGRRVPLTKDVLSFDAKQYEIRGWIEEDGRKVFRPTQMRNYFMIRWFDWQLKGQEGHRKELVNHPFGEDVAVLHEEGVKPAN